MNKYLSLLRRARNLQAGSRIDTRLEECAGDSLTRPVSRTAGILNFAQISVTKVSITVFFLSSSIYLYMSIMDIGIISRKKMHDRALFVAVQAQKRGFLNEDRSLFTEESSSRYSNIRHFSAARDDPLFAVQRLIACLF